MRGGLDKGTRIHGFGALYFFHRALFACERHVPAVHLKMSPSFTDHCNREKTVCRPVFVLVLFLACFSVGIATAQTERPLPPPERPTGVQITNAPAGQQTRERKEEQTPAEAKEDYKPAKNAPENRTFPVEPDTDFQNLVTSSLGYRLPIFGQNLFQNVPSTFAPLDRIPVTRDYLIGPGDELLIRAWGQIDVDYHTTVDRTGAIYIPKVGSISVSGLRYDQLHDSIAAAIGRVFKNFELTVTMGQLRSIQVFMVGEVKRPGVYTIGSLSTLVNALFASGGPSNRGSMREIQLKRQGKEVTRFDLYDLIANGDKSKDVPLLPGDVIYVPPVGRLVALAGSVNTAAIFEVKERETLGDAIRYAGGLTNTASGGQAIVERIDDHHVRRADEFPLTEEGLKRELHDGDVIRFLRLSPKFDNAVTLRGNVAVPGRYPWRQGMRVQDLIPSRDALITDEYWKQQNRLGIPVSKPETGLGPAAGNVEPQATAGSQRVNPEQLKNEVRRSGAEINWGYAVIQRLDPDQLITHLLPFNLGQAIAGDPAQNLPLERGDVITIFSQADMQVPIGERSKFVRLEGEFRSAGVYRAESGETLRHLITRVGGFTSQAYLYGAEFTRESTRDDQQKRLDQYITELERTVERNAGALQGRPGEEAAAGKEALEGQRRLVEKMRQLRATGRIVLELKPNTDSLEQLPDLVLEDGDRLFVPFKPATVDVLGSVYSSNAFIFRPGKTVSDYVRIAGGVTASGDSGRTFVIRADGSTVSGRSHRGILGANFGSMQMLPGDTVVVPEKLDKGAVLRGIKDWTQIISQFVLGAAAAKVLF